MTRHSAWFLVLGVVCCSVPAFAQQPACGDSHTHGVDCFRRWDIKGFYYAAGQTLTEKSNNIATALLDSNTIDIGPGDATFPATAKLLNAYLYWSGSREAPDEVVKLATPGQVAVDVIAEKCYLDGDNRSGSLSKNFYTCRSEITGILKAGNTHFGTYEVSEVDALILPDGNPCESTKECYEAASLASGKVLSSCVVNEDTVCECKATNQCAYGQSTIGHASFSLVFVYEHGSQTRSVFLYDGMSAFIAQTEEFDLTNLKTPSTPDNQGTLTYYIVEGDNDNVAPHPFVPPDVEQAVDNPGEKVTLAWGDDNAFENPIELQNEENPIWDDPFDGTTGAGVDIETFDLAVPANRTRAKLNVHSPNIDSVNQYSDEVCTDPDTNNQCAKYHQCKCLLNDAQTDSCVQYGCVDNWSNDGIGVAYVLVGFDVFAPSFVDVKKQGSLTSNVGGVAFTGDVNADGKLSPGEEIQFACSATNVGSATATSAVFVDDLPLELTFKGWNGAEEEVYVEYSCADPANDPCSITDSAGKTGITPAEVIAGTVTVELQDIKIGETVTVHFNCAVSAGVDWTSAGAVIFNQARFEADFIDPVVTDWDDKPGDEDPTEINIEITDVDDDGHPDHEDNCPTDFNPGQENLDGDKYGDVCDDDIDNDGHDNDDDSCPEDPDYHLQADAGKCQDYDEDGVMDAGDNCTCKAEQVGSQACLDAKNTDQNDLDSDDVGDVCDPDLDGDGLSNKDETETFNTKPDDADSDDDGLLDGEEINGVERKKEDGSTVTYTSDANDCDSDDDGLPDGLEAGVGKAHPHTASCPAGDSNCVECFIADTHPQSTTDPQNPDTDSGGVSDGAEDRNKNGAVDGEDLNPNDGKDDLVIAGGSTLIGACEAEPSGHGGALAIVVVALALLWVSRRRRIPGLLLLAVGLATVATPLQEAAAQTEVNYSPFRFAGNSKGLIMTDAGELEAPFDWHLALGMSYADRPVVLRNGLNLDEVAGELPVERRLGADIAFAMSFASWFELDVYLPFVINQSGQDPNTRESISSFALGDITLTPRFRIAGSKKGGGFLTLLLPVTFPTGKATAGSFAQEPMVTGRPTLAMSAGDRVVWAMNLGTVLRQSTDEFAVQNNMEFTFSTGFEFGLIPDTSFLLLDFYGSTQFSHFFEDQQSTPLEGLLGYKHRFRKFYLLLGGGVGITHGRGVPQWRVFFNFNYASELLDRDGDGIGDDDDMCPEDPEDFDKWQDVDGCPDPDNDSDGILDASDSCPNEPEDVDNFEDADGCPEADNDRDGILDAADKCPLQPEDKDSFEDEDGCPDPDNDQDGIVDVDDRCPLKPEDRDNFEDADGCPDPDNDQDKILDAADTCPNEPENYNGYKDEDGCPDIVFTCTEFKIPEKIYFRTGSHRIQSQSFALLNVVAETIIAHPEAALTQVQGHTDRRGSRRYNVRLSNRRAKSVVDYLVKAGVPRERLEFKGFGPDQPLEEGKDGPDFYDQNRRVQFIVLKLDPTASQNCQK